MDYITKIGAWFWHHKLLLVALCIFLIEVALRYGAPRSALYRSWSALFISIGKVWTAILLSVIYAISVGPVSLVMRAIGKDVLDKRIGPEPTFWRRHEPSTLSTADAARHQF